MSLFCFVCLNMTLKYVIYAQVPRHSSPITVFCTDCKKFTSTTESNRASNKMQNDNQRKGFKTKPRLVLYKKSLCNGWLKYIYGKINCAIFKQVLSLFNESQCDMGILSYVKYTFATKLTWNLKYSFIHNKKLSNLFALQGCIFESSLLQ